MGLFDIFKKKENKKETEIKEEQKKYEIEYKRTKEGRIQVDFYDKNINLGQLYDTTRLVVDNSRLELAGQEVQNCMVSWYSQDDVVFLDPKYENESINARDYKNILTQINMYLLQTDENYCYNVMKSLLDQKRVTKYLEDGLKDNPEHPCGNYIGGINATEKGYKKFFSLPVGKASHDSAVMVNKRVKYKEKIEEQKQRKIAQAKAQIHQLQSEIDEMKLL